MYKHPVRQTDCTFIPVTILKKILINKQKQVV